MAMSVSMAAVIALMSVLLFGGLCDVGGARRPGTDTESRGRPAVHIHKHNGRIGRRNNSTYIKEEGKYFLTQIFEKYGRGEKEILLADFELLLERIGFEPNRIDDAREMEDSDIGPSASAEQGEHKDHEEDVNTHAARDVNNSQSEPANTDYNNKVNTDYNNKVNTDYNNKANTTRDHEENSGHGAKDRGHGDHGEKGRHEPESDRDHTRRTGHSTNKGRSPRVRRDVNFQTGHRTPSRDPSRLGSGDAQSVVVHTHDLHTECLSVQELIQIYHADEREFFIKRMKNTVKSWIWLKKIDNVA